MAKNTHIIRRQILEIEGLKEADAEEVQTKINQLFKERVLPLLDQYLSDYSKDGDLIQIEKLEIDIGNFPIDQLGEAWVNELAQELKQELPIQENSKEEKTNSPRKILPAERSLALVEYFANTGTLPWWADKPSNDIIQKSLEFLIKNRTLAFQDLLSKWTAKVKPLQRMLRHLRFPEWLILIPAKVGLPAKDLRLLLEALFTTLKTLQQSSDFPSHKYQEIIGLQLFSWIHLNANQSIPFIDFWKGFLLQLANSKKITYPIFLQQFIKEIEQSNPKRSSPLDDLINGLANTNDSLKLETSLEKKIRPTASVPKKDTFNDTEELLVTNAGLVLLWPYLARFFENMNLMKERRFVNDLAAHRAVGLLQYLADGMEEPLEYNCGLNKILCGLDWQIVLDFGEPISLAEKTACEELLQAVIQNASILGDMTLDGFRGSFLLRKGILRVGAGVWQLQVEEATYDVVLERVPWSWNMVKLPWMEWGMMVSWRDK